MNFHASELILIGLIFISGSIALAPARGQLGPWGHAVFSLPVGIVMAGVAVGINSLIGIPMGPLTVVAMITSATVLGTLTFAWLALDSQPSPRASIGPPLLMGATLLGASLIASMLDITFITSDSWANYEGTAVRLADSGVIFERLMSERLVLLPALHAFNRVFGGDWLVTVYPVMSLAMLAVLTWALRGLWEHLGRPRYGGAVVVAVPLLLAITPFTVFNAFYVHSHTISALFLLGAIVCMTRLSNGDAAIWPVLAGVCVAGLELARPDGLAYGLVLFGALMQMAMSRRSPRSAMRALTFGAVAPTAIVLGAAVASLGVWEADKLTGGTALALCVGHILVLGIAELVLRSARTRDVFAGRRGLALTGALAACACVAIIGFDATKDFEVFRILGGNLLRDGNWGILWPATAAVTVVALLRAVRSGGTLIDSSLWMIVAFMAVAFVLHVTLHPGHLGWTDSFNRIVYHVVPTVFLMFGIVVLVSLRDMDQKESTNR